VRSRLRKLNPYANVGLVSASRESMWGRRMPAVRTRHGSYAHPIKTSESFPTGRHQPPPVAPQVRLVASQSFIGERVFAEARLNRDVQSGAHIKASD
jgi:hypothetical protein